MRVNLPISNLKRDEYYTFIHGLAVACVWIIHFKGSSINSMISPAFIAAWLFSTAFLWAIYNLLSWFIDYCIRKQLKDKTVEELLQNHKVSRLSLFYTGPLEDRQINAHIFGLLTIALIISYYPISFFFLTNTAIFLLAHVFYTLITIFTLYKYRSDIYDLASINRLIAEGACDVLNERIYAQKRAEFFAELKHDEYKNNSQQKIK